MTKNEQKINEFVQFIRKFCKKVNVTLEFRRGSFVFTDDGQKADGFFQEPEKWCPGRIVIAKGVPIREWLTTLGHEFGHLLQWLYDENVYQSSDNYLAERDAEKRSLKFMKEFNLPVPETWHKKRSKNYLSWYKKTQQ